MMHRFLVRSAWVLTGVLAGTFLGILFSPSGGQEVRRKLNYQLSKCVTKLYEVVQIMYNAKHPSPSRAQVQGRELVSHTMEEAKRLLKDIDTLIARLKS